MKMHANVVVGILIRDWCDQVRNHIRIGHADRVSERNGSNTNADKFLHCSAHFILIPRIAVRISERHGNVNDDAESCLVSPRLNRLQHFVAVCECLVLVVAQKRL